MTRRYTSKFPPRLGDIVQNRDGYCGIVVNLFGRPETGLYCDVVQTFTSSWHGPSRSLILKHRPRRTLWTKRKETSDGKA